VAVCRASGYLDAGIGTVISFNGGNSEPSPGASEIVSWSWDFGDGATATGSEPTHAYGDAGQFVPTLTVTDDQGLTAQDSCPVIDVHS
jgi:chitodextrinase